MWRNRRLQTTRTLIWWVNKPDIHLRRSKQGQSKWFTLKCLIFKKPLPLYTGIQPGWDQFHFICGHWHWRHPSDVRPDVFLVFEFVYEAEIQLQLTNNDLRSNGTLFSPRMKSDILECLASQISTAYPSSAEFDAVAEARVKKDTCLRFCSWLQWVKD